MCPLIGSFQICQTSNGIVKIDGEKAEIDKWNLSDTSNCCQIEFHFQVIRSTSYKAVKTGGEMKAAIDKDLAVNILYDSGS